MICSISTAYLRKVALDELVRLLLQRITAVLLGKVGDPDGVCGIQLPFQECAARVHDMWHLEHGGGGQQLAHRHLSHSNMAGVHEVDHSSHCRRTDLPKDGYFNKIRTRF